MQFRVVILAALMLGSIATQAVADISGVPKIVDGNTLIIGPTKIRANTHTGNVVGPFRDRKRPST
jgi:hypothetical protein